MPRHDEPFPLSVAMLALCHVFLLLLALFGLAYSEELRLHPLQPGSASEQLFFSTVRLELVDKQYRRKFGTAFFFNPSGTIYLVTDKSLFAEDLIFAECYLPESQNNSPLASHKRLSWRPSTGPALLFHPDSSVDVVAVPIDGWKIEEDPNPSLNIYIRAIDPSAVLNNDQLFIEMRGVERVLMYGYPYGLALGLPVVRDGITAIPTWIDYSPGFSQPLNRIVHGLGMAEVALAPGSCGSPLIYIDLPFGGGLTTLNRHGHPRTPRFYFLGMMSKTLQNANVSSSPTIQPISTAPNLGDHTLGLYWKAHRIAEMFQTRNCNKDGCP